MNTWGFGLSCRSPFPGGTRPNPRSVQEFVPARSPHVIEIDEFPISGTCSIASAPSVSGDEPSHVTPMPPHAWDGVSRHLSVRFVVPLVLPRSSIQIFRRCNDTRAVQLCRRAIESIRQTLPARRLSTGHSSYFAVVRFDQHCIDAYRPQESWRCPCIGMGWCKWWHGCLCTEIGRS